jgi:ornithine cyclodeaminase/alanine dehydrogenase-like protein (mu-crystallin family)
MGMFNRMSAKFSPGYGVPDQLIMDATHLNGHRTAAALPKEGIA